MTVEANRLNWIRENQAAIRAESYEGLREFVRIRAINPQTTSNLQAIRSANRLRRSRSEELLYYMHAPTPTLNVPTPRTITPQFVIPPYNGLLRSSSQENLLTNNVRREKILYNRQRVGTRVILPATYVGSARYMRQSYQVIIK
jgi:hypothetical protein